jgi:hypothetical protein
MKEKKGKDARLRCRIAGDELVISIGISTLAFAFVNGPVGDRLVYVEETGEWDDSRLRVTNPAAFAKEVVHALLDEEEDGSSPLTNLLDAAYQAVVDDGGEGFWTPDFDAEPDSPDAIRRTEHPREDGQ